ncbi:uncharacterized protein [Solanum lycopersicum]|uniref:uncharacterized protein n=1 Tax=Solanum lycopersicum TaxID=4081 RepID=UPI0037499C29
MVVDSRVQMTKFLYGVSDLVKTECRNVLLSGDMNISRLLTHAKQVEVDKLREQSKENKKARTGYYDYSQQYDQKGKSLGSKTQRCVSGTKTYPTFPMCDKNYLVKCHAGKEECFGCGQFGHKFRDCPSRQGQGRGNGRAQSITSVAPASRPTQQGNLSSTCGSQCHYRLYVVQARQDQENSPNVNTEYALSRLLMGSVAHVEKERKELVKDVHRIARLGDGLISISESGVTVQNGT